MNFKRTRPNYAVHQMKSSLVDACHLAERSIASMVLQVSFDLTFTGWGFFLRHSNKMFSSSSVQ